MLSESDSLGRRHQACKPNQQLLSNVWMRGHSGDLRSLVASVGRERGGLSKSSRALCFERFTKCANVVKSSSIASSLI